MRCLGFLEKYADILRRQGGSMAGAAEKIETAIKEYREAEAALARASDVVNVFLDEAISAAFGGGGISEYFAEYRGAEYRGCDLPNHG